MTAGDLLVRGPTAGTYRPARLGEVRLYQTVQLPPSRGMRPLRNRNNRIIYRPKQICLDIPVKLQQKRRTRRRPTIISGDQGPAVLRDFLDLRLNISGARNAIRTDVDGSGALALAADFAPHEFFKST